MKPWPQPQLVDDGGDGGLHGEVVRHAASAAVPVTVVATLLSGGAGAAAAAGRPSLAAAAWAGSAVAVVTALVLVWVRTRTLTALVAPLVDVHGPAPVAALLAASHEAGLRLVDADHASAWLTDRLGVGCAAGHLPHCAHRA